MPLVAISLRKGKSPDHIRAIADGVHAALVTTYGVPAADRFQMIREYEPAHLIYDPTYLGVHRTDDVVFIHIVASDWRDLSAKAAFYKDCTDRLADDPGLRHDDVQIVLSPNTSDDWCFGNGVPAYPRP